MDQHLKITISGDPLEGKNPETFQQRVIEKMAKVTEDPTVEMYHFAMIHYRFVFSAVNMDMRRIDTLNNQIIRLTGFYLTKWTYAINIRYTEAEKE